jgi:hypothetical protein
MQNHLHQVLRSRPDVVKGWSDEEVARRWLRLFPERRNEDGSPAEPSQPEIDSIVNDPDKLSKRRRRLSDISWWARCTAENIARQSNREDNVTGHFWEGRYKSQLLLDEAALLACTVYVDLNPIRAAMAQTPETSLYTGAKDRIDDLRTRDDRTRLSDHQWERSGGGKRSGWMSPIEIDERADPIGSEPSESGRRASEKGFLPISLCAYLELLDWTGRAIRSDKRGSIPGHLASILTRLGLNTSLWCDVVREFGRLFKQAVGTAASLDDEASRRGQRWMQAPGTLT